MDRMIYTAMSGAKWTLERQASVAQNLANASSTGYRAEEHRLRAVPVQTEAFASRAFVVDASVKNDFTPGPLQQTGGAYDVAIKGSGWFALAMPDGTEAYTRNGHLQISPTGVLQNHNGIPVQGETGPITVPPDTEVTIGADGTLAYVNRQAVMDWPQWSSALGGEPEPPMQQVLASLMRPQQRPDTQGQQMTIEGQNARVWICPLKGQDQPLGHLLLVELLPEMATVATGHPT